jgi:hypothetical protein
MLMRPAALSIVAPPADLAYSLEMPSSWPALALDGWRDTYATVHMWSQVVGKVALALTPPLNHFWNAALQVTARGLATPRLTSAGRAFTVEFDFVAHELAIYSSDGETESVPLRPMTVAAFYDRTMQALRRAGAEVRIWPMPVEIPDPIRFEADTVHASYDPAAVIAFWQALLSMAPVFEAFRARYLGKSSPMHFFWGSFDLASTRFSGRPAPARPGTDAITREAYSHEVISHGFWLGSGAVQEPAFYAYAAPEPAGLRDASILPRGASYNASLSEFILPYDRVRRAPDPAADLLSFLESTYDAAANLGEWDRGSLER